MRKAISIAAVFFTLSSFIYFAAPAKAAWCYQESANVSSTCGSITTNNTGAYIFSGDVWQGAGDGNKSLIDGDWSTFGYDASNGGSAVLYIDYSKPQNATSSSLWQVKDGINTVNLTIQSSCWNYNASAVKLQVFSEQSSGQYSYWLCYDGGWQTLRNTAGAGSKNIYEESMWWKLNFTPSMNIISPAMTYVQNSTIPLNYTVSNLDNSIDKCWYSLDNASVIDLSGCINTTLPVMQAGSHNVAVFSNSTSNATNFSSVAFTYNPFQNFTANNSVTGGQITSFQLLIPDISGVYSTTNGTVPVPLSTIGYGSRTLNFIAADYNSTTFTRTFDAGSLQTSNYTLYPNSINITAYDESAAGLGLMTNITFNLTITNTTASTTWYNQSIFFKNASQVPTGDVQMDISSYGYNSRTYYATIQSNMIVKLYAYLLPTADAYFVRFHALTSSDAPINNAGINVKRFLGGSWQTVGEENTDESGSAGIYLNPYTSHQVTVSATGFVTQTSAITPSSPDYYFYMASTANTTYHTCSEGTTFFVLPSDPSITTNTSYDLVFNISDINSSLQWFSSRLTHNVTTPVQFLNSTASPSGGNITWQLNTSYLAGNYTLLVQYKKPGCDVFNGSYVFHIRNVTPGIGSLTDLLTRFRDSDAPPMFKSMVAIFASFMAAGAVSRKDYEGGGFLAFAILLLFAYYGWFTWNVMLLTCLTMVAVYALKGGI